MEKQLKRALKRLLASTSFSQRMFWIGQVAELEQKLAEKRG